MGKPFEFGSLVFNETVMRERLPHSIFLKVEDTVKNGTQMTFDTANIVASAMRDWAMEHGATHFTHWFQPLTGITAEKHESFLHTAPDGNVICEFSGKELIWGESDASSFPNGGLRNTFEARGYTAWDPTSFAFIKDGVLCIPTAFCSYAGEALDYKTPLLRSMDALNLQAKRLLKIFGHDVEWVKPTVGAEQEYFLIDEKDYFLRKDILYTGRTLFGCPPPKGQELGDHYSGSMKPRVLAYMKEVNEILWKLGIPAKTMHNEVAPAQHELAPIFTIGNMALDQNQITMEVLQNVARKHGMVCLLHEKPFGGVNGSGKHNNWSLITSKGQNLFDPGTSPQENAQFLLFLMGVVEAVDEFQGLLRLSAASYGNDIRLGGHEAPPPIVSIYLGEQLTGILNAIENSTSPGSKDTSYFKIGVHALPKFPKDATDRNRTSPMAFTGSKFEFRMLGAPSSIGDVNVMLNTAVANIFRKYADILENRQDLEEAIPLFIRNVVKAHKRIIFDGNGYEQIWWEEAKKRGLEILEDTPQCIPYWTLPKTVALFETEGVYNLRELVSRREVATLNYYHTVSIEAKTILEMLSSELVPSAEKYIGDLAKTAMSKQGIGVAPIYEKEKMQSVSEILQLLTDKANQLHHTLCMLKTNQPLTNRATLDTLKTAKKLMEVIRGYIDQLEQILPKDLFPYPSYGDMLFRI